MNTIFCADCKHRPTNNPEGFTVFPDNVCPFQYKIDLSAESSGWTPKDTWFCLKGEEKKEMDDSEKDPFEKFKEEVELMVFDWDKAAQIIKETRPKKASAGLEGDWFWTAGVIYENGTPITEPDSLTKPYLASWWAVPTIEINNGWRIACYKMESETPGWNAGTCWPESALQILKEKQNEIN